MPARFARSIGIALAAVVACGGGVRVSARKAQAQAAQTLPQAPIPQSWQVAEVQASSGFQIAGQITVRLPFVLLQDKVPAASASTDPDAAEAQSANPPVLSMAPHSEDARYWVSGQANSILQMHGHFHSPYEGPNSLRDIFETKASEVGTLYLGYQLKPNTRFNTDLIVDFENAGGRGISQALGLAGATNLDVVRNPNLSTVPYISRGEIHQIIGLTDDMSDQERSWLALATKVPVRRFEIRIGKMSVPDVFDVNSVGSDSHLQFVNWTIDNNGAWDYAADTRGYTVGGILEYDDRVWSARYGIFAMPVIANGIDLDWAFNRANGQNWEWEVRKGLLSPWQKTKRVGAIRVLSYANHAHMGDYRESVNEYLDGITATPEITATEKFGTVKYGFGVNTEQEVTDSLRLFGRFGWNEDQHESFAYTEVGQTVEFGGDYAGHDWHRLNDKLGVAFVSNAIKRDHQAYLHYGGLGFLLGDGGLTYAREDITEWYYNAHIWRGLFGTFGGTQIFHPGYNAARGPVYVTTVRAHIDF
ncbi:MAG: carbohydrate porin [Terracidiphilus sp.]